MGETLFNYIIRVIICSSGMLWGFTLSRHRVKGVCLSLTLFEEGGVCL